MDMFHTNIMKHKIATMIAAGEIVSGVESSIWNIFQSYEVWKGKLSPPWKMMVW